jgi:hypothetical protein
MSTSNVPRRVPQDLNAFQRVDVRVRMPHLDPELLVTRRQVLSHAVSVVTRTRSLSRGRRADLFKQVVDLAV